MPGAWDPSSGEERPPQDDGVEELRKDDRVDDCKILGRKAEGVCCGRSLGPLEKTRVFGMTPPTVSFHYCTVKLVELLAVPPGVVTEIFPVTAPVGTVVVI